MQPDRDRRCKARARQNSFLTRVEWIVVGTAYLWCGLCATAVRAQIASTAPSKVDSQSQRDANRDANCGIIYLGIVGALETSNNKRSGVVQIRDTLRGPAYPDVCARSFSPYVRTAGLHWLLKHFPARPGRLTDDELERAPKVILVGHSAGGWAVLSVARNLRRKSIPVELTVLVDSVGITDRTVPKNVKAAAIFHARDVFMLLTRKRLRLEDPSQTKMVATVLVKGAGHESVTRDPRIRDLVMSTVESLRAASASPGGRQAQSQSQP
jgi:hypothetical protein